MTKAGGSATGNRGPVPKRGKGVAVGARDEGGGPSPDDPAPVDLDSAHDRAS